MKTFFLSFFAFFTLLIVQAQDGIVPANQSDILFKVVSVDMGEITYMGEAKCEFIFKNISDRPIAITNVRASCGCTSPEWSKEPIRKKKKGSITVTYDTKRIGKFSKSVYVYTDRSEQPVQLKIKGNVLRPEEGTSEYDTLQHEMNVRKVMLEQRKEQELNRTQPGESKPINN
jgi:hypothetical protein